MVNIVLQTKEKQTKSNRIRNQINLRNEFLSMTSTTEDLRMYDVRS